MSYYPRIRDLREDHDLTQRQIAAILEISQPQYNLYEQGLRDIPTEKLIRLADYYNTTIEFLLGRTHDPSPLEENKGNASY